MTPWLRIEGDRAKVHIPGALFNAHGGRPAMLPNDVLGCAFFLALGTNDAPHWVTFAELPPSLCRIASDAVAREAMRLHLKGHAQRQAEDEPPATCGFDTHDRTVGHSHPGGWCRDIEIPCGATAIPNTNPPRCALHVDGEEGVGPV